VEVENSRKSRRRLDQRLRYYVRQTKYQEVWYVVGRRRQAGRIRELAANFDFVRVWEEVEILGHSPDRTN